MSQRIIRKLPLATACLAFIAFSLGSVLGDTLAAYAQQAASAPEDIAWSLAESKSTPQAWLDFAASYPTSSHFKLYSGTARGRYYMTMGQATVSTTGVSMDTSDGVLFTVAGTEVHLFLSVEDALTLGVMDWRPADSIRSGTKLKIPVISFNVSSWEMQAPNLFRKETSSNPNLARGVVLVPKDILNAVLVVSADGAKLLALDLSKAKTTDHTDTSHATFPNSARRPSTGYNPESQTATYSQTMP